VSNPRSTRAELLAPVKRWNFLAKFWLCDGIRRGVITIDEAKRAHELTDEELNRWYALYLKKGADGLRNINITHRRRAA
jgi:hypothetical protein